MKIRRITAVLLVLAALFLNGYGVLPSAVYAEETGAAPLRDGAFRIRNRKSGDYLSVNGYYYLDDGSRGVYLKNFDQQDLGQCFYLRRAENECWRIVSAVESGKYVVSAENGTTVGSDVKRSETAGTASLFDIYQVEDGGYTIAPSVSENLFAVLASGRSNGLNGSFVEIADYRIGDERQLWDFEKVEESSSLSVAFTNKKLKIYSVGRFYSRLMPFIGTEAADAEWTSSDDSILLVGKDGSYSALRTGTVTVTASAEGKTASFTATVCDEGAFTWFSQNNIFTSDWDGTLLQDLFFYNYGVKKRFAVNDDGHPMYPSWIDTGCSICSVAQVLNNMGAVMTNGYDLRSGQSGGLPADPYTVALANTFNYEVYGTDRTAIGNPVYISWQWVADAFNKNGERIMYRAVYTQDRATIKKLVDAHPQGIVAELSSSVRTHYVVIGKCLNPDAANPWEYEFEIFDPAAYLPSEGAGVPMRETTSNKYLGLGYYSISCLRIYDVESRYLD